MASIAKLKGWWWVAGSRRCPGLAVGAPEGAATREARLHTPPVPRRSWRSGLRDLPAFRMMTTGYRFAISRRCFARALHLRFALLENRGRREDRVRAAPAVSCANCAHKTAHEHTGAAGTLRPSLRNGFTAYFVLSPENGSFASVARGNFASPHLTPAPRRPNHTTSPYASGAHVYRALSVHRISPRVRDDRERPSSAVRRAELCRLICVRTKAEYF